METLDCIRSRRTHFEFAGYPVSVKQEKTLLEAALKAPNHKRNQPWRFVLVRHPQRESFMNKLLPLFPSLFSDQEHDQATRKRDRFAQRFGTIGLLVYVTSKKGSTEKEDWENYAACSCAVQNMMLAAESMQLGSFWSTGKIFTHPQVQKLLGVNSEDRFVGAIWFGEKAKDYEAPVYELEPRLRYWEE